MFRIFKRKRKQCVSCRKTFYKPAYTLRVTSSNGWTEIEFRVSPCCQTDYIIV
jgi:hypothetical protein